MFSSAVFSAGQWCVGTIDNTYIGHDGSVFITGSWRGEHTQVCNLTTAWKSVATDTCKTWVSYIQVAFASRSKVTMHYNDVASCGEIPSYSTSPKPSYIMLRLE